MRLDSLGDRNTGQAQNTENENAFSVEVFFVKGFGDYYYY